MGTDVVNPPTIIPKNEVINLTCSQQSFGKLADSKKEIPSET